MSEFLEICQKQLVEIEKETKKKPPGDTRALTFYIIEKIRDRICATDAKIQKNPGANITPNKKEIEELFKLLI